MHSLYIFIVISGTCYSTAYRDILLFNTSSFERIFLKNHFFYFQHLKSPKHHMKASTVDGAQSDPDKKVKSVVTESPLLNMFLKTLVTSPQAFFSTSSDKEGEEGSNTEVER